MIFNCLQCSANYTICYITSSSNDYCIYVFFFFLLMKDLRCVCVICADRGPVWREVSVEFPKIVGLGERRKSDDRSHTHTGHNGPRAIHFDPVAIAACGSGLQRKTSKEHSGEILRCDVNERSEKKLT